ncbi:glycosyltransferase family 2 protein [Lactobacillus helveticus]|uniref:glycosyltransferase family 2 protein n=1 Tax=Lactobacillus helveticus TaxID=1587 RepID=UPI001563E013|nr:glycosyltransferase family 2 protein [Lactobacillus helveticus]NRO93653.1 putative glycosyltransferase EpsJ [Lactobacillus helveticus]
MILSIVIPAYNEEKLIFRCLSSIAKNFTECENDMEVVVVDDGSTDNTINEVNKCKIKNLKLILKSNGGVSSARNIGIKNSSGKFVWFIDSDDYLLNFDGKQLLSMLSKKKNIDMFLLGFKKKLTEYDEKVVVNKEKKILDHKQFIKHFNEIFSQNEFNVPWNRIIKRSVITTNNIKFDIQMKTGEDALFNCKLVKYVQKIYIINKPLYMYNLFYSRQIKKYDPELRFNLLKLNKALKYLVINQNINRSFFENRYERMNYTLLANLAQKCNRYYEFKKQISTELLPSTKINFCKLGRKEKIFFLLVKFNYVGYLLAKKDSE